MTTNLHTMTQTMEFMKDWYHYLLIVNRSPLIRRFGSVIDTLLSSVALTLLIESISDTTSTHVLTFKYVIFLNLNYYRCRRVSVRCL